MIRLAYYEHPSYVPLLHRAYELWSELELASGEQPLQMTGGLMIGAPDGEVVSGSLASARQHGLEHELLDATEVARRYPALRLAPDEVALYESRAGILAPEQCVAAHIRLACAAGARSAYSAAGQGVASA